MDEVDTQTIEAYNIFGDYENQPHPSRFKYYGVTPSPFSGKAWFRRLLGWLGDVSSYRSFADSRGRLSLRGTSSSFTFHFQFSIFHFPAPPYSDLFTLHSSLFTLHYSLFSLPSSLSHRSNKCSVLLNKQKTPLFGTNKHSSLRNKQKFPFSDQTKAPFFQSNKKLRFSDQIKIPLCALEICRKMCYNRNNIVNGSTK